MVSAEFKIIATIQMRLCANSIEYQISKASLQITFKFEIHVQSMNFSSNLLWRCVIYSIYDWNAFVLQLNCIIASQMEICKFSWERISEMRSTLVR